MHVQRHSELRYLPQHLSLYPDKLNTSQNELSTIEFVALLHSLGFLSTRPSRTFVKVPAFLFIKDHKKQEKVSGRSFAVVQCTEGSFLTNQYWPNQTRVNVFLLKGNKDVKKPQHCIEMHQALKIYRQRLELPLPCIFTFPCSISQSVPQFELFNRLYLLLTECKR